MTIRNLTAALATIALLVGCATMSAPSGPPAQCLLHAENVGIQESRVAEKAGLSSSAAMLYGVGERGNARMACALLGLIVVATDERLWTGAVTPTRAFPEADAQLKKFSISAVGDAAAGARMAGWAQPFIPRSAETFHDDLAGWKEVTRKVESDPNIPAAKAIIASARAQMRSW